MAALVAVNVNVELPLPGAAIEAGLKTAVTPDGSPVAESATAWLKAPTRVVVMVAVLVAPCATETDREMPRW